MYLLNEIVKGTKKLRGGSRRNYCVIFEISFGHILQYLPFTLPLNA